MDHRWCSCGGCWVARGPTNPLIGCTKIFPVGVDLNVDATEEELFKDWEEQKNEFGKV